MVITTNTQATKWRSFIPHCRVCGHSLGRNRLALSPDCPASDPWPSEGKGHIPHHLRLKVNVLCFDSRLLRSAMLGNSSDQGISRERDMSGIGWLLYGNERKAVKDENRECIVTNGVSDRNRKLFEVWRRPAQRLACRISHFSYRTSHFPLLLCVCFNSLFFSSLNHALCLRQWRSFAEANIKVSTRENPELSLLINAPSGSE